MNILITGASGHIGTNLALRCLAEGFNVYGIDNRPNPWTSSFPLLQHNLTGSDTATILAEAMAAPRTPAVVVHLAAHAKVHQLVIEPSKALENIAMTQQVLEYCRKMAVPIILASSREIYGEAFRHETDEDDADFSLSASTYAASKLAGEALVYSYSRCYGLPYMVLRLSNVYGRYDNDLHRMERVVPLFIHKLRCGEPLTVFGGDKVLDFTYVDDCIDGIMRAILRLTEGSVVNETMNLSRGEGHTLRQVCHLLADALGTKAQILEAPLQAGEISRYVARIDRARQLLGYAPRVSLPEGLRRAVAWTG